jgi:hypothetical protein
VSRGPNPLHFTHAHNLPKVVCGGSSRGKRRTSSREDLERDTNPCPACLGLVQMGGPEAPAAPPPAVEQSAKAPRPREWHPSQGPAPKLLAVTLHQPWQEAFFLGGPMWHKDVENRSERFHDLPPGTLLALHTSKTYSREGAEFIMARLPEMDLALEDLPPMEAGVIVGVVQVQLVTHGGVGRAHTRRPPRATSPWYMNKGCGVWLAEERVRFAKPIPAGPGQFGAWHLPEAVRAAVVAELLGRPLPAAVPAGPRVLAERPHSNGSGHEWTLAVSGGQVDLHFYNWGVVQVVAGPNIQDWGSHLGLTAAGKLRAIPPRAINEGFPAEVESAESERWIAEHPRSVEAVEAFFRHRPEFAAKVRRVEG